MKSITQCLNQVLPPSVERWLFLMSGVFGDPRPGKPRKNTAARFIFPLTVKVDGGAFESSTPDQETTRCGCVRPGMFPLRGLRLCQRLNRQDCRNQDQGKKVFQHDPVYLFRTVDHAMRAPKQQSTAKAMRHALSSPVAQKILKPKVLEPKNSPELHKIMVSRNKSGYNAGIQDR